MLNARPGNLLQTERPQTRPRRWGQVVIEVSLVAEVVELIQSERVRLNPDCLAGLYQQLGADSAEHVLCRAIEELAVRLTECERLWQEEQWAEMRKCARSLIAISDQIGMTTLSRVAADVTTAIDTCDLSATGATLFRLIRTGERSLTAVWDHHDLSI